MKRVFSKSHRAKHLAFITLLLILIAYAGAFSYLSIRNHDLYQTFAWDLGFFDQLLWQASRGNLNFTSTIGNINILGDHFQPIIYLIAPLYWLWDDVRIILISQAILVTTATIPIYLLAVKKFNSVWPALAISISYLLFGGTQFTITNEFHQSAFIPLLLSLGLFWMEAGKRNLGILAILSLLLVKEEMGLLVVALGISPALRSKAGPLLMLAGVLSFFLLIKIVIPAVSSQGRYIHYGYGSLGQAPMEVANSIINNPITGLKMLIEPKIKLEQVGASIISFGGLPLLSPVNLIPIFQNYAVRFLDDRNIHRWLNNNHYSAPLGPLLAYGSTMAISSLRGSLFRGRRGNLAFLSSYLIAVSILTAIILKLPIWSLFKSQLYFTPQWVKDDNSLLAEIPPGASVAANNSLIPHLSHRDKNYLLPEIGDAQFIAIDLANGPNKYSPMLFEEVNPFVEQLLRTGWCRRKQYNRAMLLERCI